ncbi:lipid storage droplets surface-binding protein 1 isoform X2 [Drosophila guanche]|uniref:Blast:Lipid storage droplets surface-binding protein 1 n=1 Tax=Drosophila guanche TaxID=7266 RepID=A0A3B0KBJ8_DROGU|nr:lipid storage droplets surface-binding protein 1 isoform X2 [Drosophila guanche]SPP83046.1 blast:Lipid storage droplets surface-binding protein 1 [Drosophila guanche]
MATATIGSGLHLEAIDRIGSIPLVESSVKRVENIYGKVKNNNRLFSWYFEAAEATISAAYGSVQPAVKLFEHPLKRLDNVMCKSLDILEQRIPLVYLPPEMMYWNTKEYMSDHLVRPVLKRADSVKQIGNAVLESPLTTYAADRIDGAFTAGDKFVDKYLVPISTDQDQTDAPQEDDNVAANEKGAIKAIHHGQRFSRKLKRRLTQRTIAEARALKKQSKEAIHVLIYAVELIATDPKQAMQRAKELWAYLSADEPENQARPATLEQLIVLLTRESARRVVHLVNFSATVASNIPRNLAHTTTEVAHQIVYINHRIITISRLDKVKSLSKEEAESLLKRALAFYGNLQGLTNSYLERVANFLSGRIEAEKVTGTDSATSNHRSSRRRQENNTNNYSAAHNNINGVY